MKKRNEAQYREIFEMEINNNEYIYTHDKKEKIRTANIKNWKQCYKKGHKIRGMLPKFWFVSDMGDLISVAKGRAYLLKKDDSDGTGRGSYHFYIYSDGNTYIGKNIEVHNLVALVFDSLIYGKAKELLKDRGLYAFGVLEKNKTNLQGHHIKSKDNTPCNLEIITTDVHTMIHKVPKELADDTIGVFIKELGAIAFEEEPNKFTILETGQRVNGNTLELVEDDNFRVIYATDEVKMSNNVIKQLQRYNTINISIDLLINNYGNDYFKEPKYLCVKDKLVYFFKCELVVDELKIKEINDITELVNKKYIMCCVNAADNKIECYIEK